MRHIDEPTLFLPGTLCDERIWMPTWRHLSFSESMRCYVPLQWANDLAQMMSLTFDRINNFKQPVHLIGFSMGGYIASLAALDHRNIASLTLVGYNPIGLSKEEEEQRLMIIKSINNNSYTPMSKNRLSHFLTEAEMESSEYADTITNMAVDLGPSTLKAHFTATTPRKDLTGRLAKLDIPIHLVTAEHDKIADTNSIKTFTETLENGKFSCLENTAHMMLLTQPEAFISRLYSPDLHSSANLG